MPYQAKELATIIEQANTAYDLFNKARVELVKEPSTSRMIANLHLLSASVQESDNTIELPHLHEQALTCLTRAIRMHSDVLRIDYLMNLPA